jgi:hypothetical protein
MRKLEKPRLISQSAQELSVMTASALTAYIAMTLQTLIRKVRFEFRTGKGSLDMFVLSLIRNKLYMYPP